MNKKALSTDWITITAVIAIIIIVITIFKYSATQQKLTIFDAPNKELCLRDYDSGYSKENCEKTYGTWTLDGICGFCKCPTRSIGWIKDFGCYFKISSKQ